MLLIFILHVKALFPDSHRRITIMKWPVLLLLLLLGAVAPVHAQTGKIAGYVRDADTGDPLPGVNVVLEDTLRGYPQGKCDRHRWLLCHLERAAGRVCGHGFFSGVSAGNQDRGGGQHGADNGTGFHPCRGDRGAGRGGHRECRAACHRPRAHRLERNHTARRSDRLARGLRPCRRPRPYRGRHRRALPGWPDG